MHQLIVMDLLKTIQRDRIEAADAYRRANGSRRRRRARADEPVVIRPAAECDARGLEVLAALDGGPTPAGPTLVAELGGQLVAALPLEGSTPVADPFVPSGALVELLKLRAKQLRTAA